MTLAQLQILGVLAVTIGLFVWGRWRHDVVALAALIASVFLGLVPSAAAFSGFGHPAVITVACVLVLSWGLQSTGAVDVLALRVLPKSAGPVRSLAAIIGLGAFLSAFMNNVGAMALLMPLGIQLAAKLDLPPGRVLMPLSFGTILGGMTTLIGTPPNLIVSGFREQAGGASFGMFDFTPAGLAVAFGGLVFLVLVGWRFVPTRKHADIGGFDTGSYLTEARVREGARASGKTIREVEQALQEADAQIIGMVRNRFRVFAPNAQRVLQDGDILVIEAEPESLGAVFSSLGLELEDHAPLQPAVDKDGAEGEGEERQREETELQELAVMPNSLLIGRTARAVQLRTRFGLNLLAISRQGRQTIKRLRSTEIQAGDVLLLQGEPAAISGFAAEFGCVPLAGRSISIPDRRKAMLAGGIMALAIGGAAFGLVPAAVSFAAGVVAFMVLRVIPLRRLYEAIDWPVIVLLGSLIPVAVAMESTGFADLLARSLLDNVALGRPVVALTLILIVAMTLSDFMNNAATAAVMCPIAISTASQLKASPDAFLMAVAVGASCAFLTPIGHQNNTLILGPGGFRFSDYWRLGLPMEVLVVAVAIPALMYFWPL
ncbi:MAG TPA: SLC13 family permease [Xanthomonadales bacterium]|nr:SLC13 family permease [Xanthomonadales bacterium]